MYVAGSRASMSRSALHGDEASCIPACDQRRRRGAEPFKDSLGSEVAVQRG